uniref:DUF3054 domain-containing protein n=1 Tax=Chaetoceros debilis TaxID=122233 RepID=A0A7S3VAB7_9STRA
MPASNTNVQMILRLACIFAFPALNTQAFQINHHHRHTSTIGVQSERSLLNFPSVALERDGISVTSKSARSFDGLGMAGNDEDSSSFTSLSTPLDKPALAAVDFLALLVFAGVGKASHSADGSLDIAAILTTAFPFFLAWFATSPFTGIYESSNSGVNEENTILDAGKLAAKGWIVAIPLGCAIRGVIRGYVPPAPFVVVTLLVTLIMLGGSRMLYAVVEDKMVQDE